MSEVQEGAIPASARFSLIDAASLAVDEYAQAGSHGECWTGSSEAYQQHLTDCRIRAMDAISALLLAERSRWLCAARSVINADQSELSGAVASLADLVRELSSQEPTMELSK